jgi:hypothetical protein
MRRFLLVVLCFCVAFCVAVPLVVGQSTGAVAPTVAPVVATPVTVVPAATIIPSWIQPFLVTILTALSALFVAALGWLTKIVIQKTNASAADTQAIQAVQAGVVDVQRTYVDALKTAAPDGKLTSAQISTANALAIAKAKEVALGAGKDLLLTLGSEHLNGLVESVLAKLKIAGFGSAPAAPTVAPKA